MLEPDVVIATTEIVFSPGKEDFLPDGRTMLEYVVAEDYQDTITALEAFDNSRASLSLHIERHNSSLSFDKTATSHSEAEFMWYRIDISQLMKQSKDDVVKIEVREYHKRRRNPFPEETDL